MNKSESKYFNTAALMDEALLSLLIKKDFEYITIKEICEMAGVNRSTFYLHYRNTTDLLIETIEYTNKKFMARFSNVSFNPKNKSILEEAKENLLFIKEEYLIPFLEYIKDNKKLFIYISKNGETLQVSKTYAKLFINIIEPIMYRFGVSEKERKYLATYYINGIMAIVLEWINNECVDDIDFVSDLIKKIVMKDMKHQSKND